MMDDIDDSIMEQTLDIGDTFVDEPIGECASSPDSQEHRWPRRPLAIATLNQTNSFMTASGASNSLAFHWLDIDMMSGQPLKCNPDGGNVIGKYAKMLRFGHRLIKRMNIEGSTQGPVPIIRMYGVTGDGRSVLAFIHGFTPYFYASLPSSIDLTEQNLALFRNSLDQRVRIFICDALPCHDYTWLLCR